MFTAISHIVDEEGVTEIQTHLKSYYCWSPSSNHRPFLATSCVSQRLTGQKCRPNKWRGNSIFHTESFDIESRHREVTWGEG